MAILAEEETQDTELSDFHLGPSADDGTTSREETLSSWTTPNEEDASAGSLGRSFRSALGFLQAALPEIPTERLRSALQGFDQDVDDMWELIATILTEEYIREKEERGLDGLDEDDLVALGFGAEDDWELVQTKKPQKKVKQNNARGKKYLLADIRQQHHIQAQTSSLARHKRASSGALQSALAAGDPWTQISSLSTHLATILPPHPASMFPPFFHSHKYATPYDALRAALQSLCKPSTSTPCKEFSDIEPTEHIAVLFNLLDIVLAEYEDVDVEERERLVADVELSIAVSNGQGDCALDLVHLLRELDTNTDLGLYHAQVPPPSSPSTVTINPARSTFNSTTKKSNVPSQPPPIAPPPSLRYKPPPDPDADMPKSRQKHKSYQTQWQTVPHRKAQTRGPHPLAAHIPTYAKDVNGNRTGARRKGGGPGGGGGEEDKSQMGFSHAMRSRMSESLRKRTEMLQEASRVWQKGNKKNRGGEVAAYFAERVSVAAYGLFFYDGVCMSNLNSWLRGLACWWFRPGSSRRWPVRSN